VVSSAGGGPNIGSPEQALVVIALLAIAALIWFWKFAD
jgi:hypothetical protein